MLGPVGYKNYKPTAVPRDWAQSWYLVQEREGEHVKGQKWGSG